MATAWSSQHMDAAAAWSSQHMGAVRSDCEFVSWQSHSVFSDHFKHYSVISEASNLSPVYAKTWSMCLQSVCRICPGVIHGLVEFCRVLEERSSQGGPFKLSARQLLENKPTVQRLPPAVSVPAPQPAFAEYLMRATPREGPPGCKPGNCQRLSSTTPLACRWYVCLLSVVFLSVCVFVCFFECLFCHGRQCSLQFLLRPVPLRYGYTCAFSDNLDCHLALPLPTNCLGH